MKAYIKDMTKLQKSLFEISETSVKVKTIDGNEELKTMFNILDSNFKSMQPFIEETVDRWNQRTVLIKNMQ